jgi:AAA domain-containing protein
MSLPESMQRGPDGVSDAEYADELVASAPSAPVVDLEEQRRRSRTSSPSSTSSTRLEVQSFAELAAEVDARGPRQWLIRGIWPAGDYGVHGAEPKAGKTWNALDLAVSVASGTPWLGLIDVDQSGPVLVFAGEGGAGNIVRRVRAIAESRGIDADSLPLHICQRAPHLSDAATLAEFEKHLAALRPVLVIVDPLYLAARGANSGSLYEMGAVLEGPQHACQAIGAALQVVTHYNRSRDLTGADRLTGAGPAEWGRVLLTADVASRHTDPETLATTVVCELRIRGGEIPDRTVRIRRTIRALDPDDIDSPLEYTVDLPDDDEALTTPTRRGDGIPRARAKLLAALDARTEPATQRQLVDWIADRYGHGLTRQTCSRELNALHASGYADTLDTLHGLERYWYRVRPSEKIRHVPVWNVSPRTCRPYR